METGMRTHHPFHMHDAILAQPEAFARTVGRNGEATDGLAAEAASRGGRIFVVGIGTSYHAARVGEYLMLAYGGDVDARAVRSFDFALYGPKLSPEDCVVGISHRGNKRYTVEALSRAREAGCLTALVTGEGGAEMETDHVLTTVGQEKSAAHTVSYTGAVDALASLAAALGRRHVAGGSFLKEDYLTEGLPAALREALGTEGEVAALAREHEGKRRIWLSGGGPSAVTAEETALKIKETSYLQAEGMATETMIHGPLVCAEAEDLFVLVAPGGPARERTLELAGLVVELGAPCLIVGDSSTGMPEGTRSVTVPPVPEPFSALVCGLPLQLFAYGLALSRGTNPDSFRTDDPRFPNISEGVRL